MVVLIIYAKGYLWKAGYGNVAQTRVSCIGDIRIETIADLSFYKSKGTFNTFCDKPLFRWKGHKYIILDSKNGVRKLTGRTGDKVSSELFYCKGFVSGQRMFWRADTGHRGAGKLLYHREEAFCPYFMPRAAMSWVFSTIPRIEGNGIIRMEGRSRGNSWDSSFKTGGKRFISV